MYTLNKIRINVIIVQKRILHVNNKSWKKEKTTYNPFTVWFNVKARFSREIVIFNDRKLYCKIATKTINRYTRNI